jgi:hypothetical protein
MSSNNLILIIRNSNKINVIVYIAIYSTFTQYIYKDNDTQKKGNDIQECCSTYTVMNFELLVLSYDLAIRHLKIFM